MTAEAGHIGTLESFLTFRLGCHVLCETRKIWCSSVYHQHTYVGCFLTSRTDGFCVLLSSTRQRTPYSIWSPMPSCPYRGQKRIITSKYWSWKSMMRFDVGPPWQWEGGGFLAQVARQRGEHECCPKELHTRMYQEWGTQLWLSRDEDEGIVQESHVRGRTSAHVYKCLDVHFYSASTPSSTLGNSLHGAPVGSAHLRLVDKLLFHWSSHPPKVLEVSSEKSVWSWWFLMALAK